MTVVDTNIGYLFDRMEGGHTLISLTNKHVEISKEGFDSYENTFIRQ